MTNQVMKFLTSKFEISCLTVGEIVQSITNQNIVIDPRVQRKLDRKRKREIAAYIMAALEGKSQGAYFAAITASRRPSGEIAILDGQHRFFGAWAALQTINEMINDLLSSGLEEDKETVERLLEYASIIEMSVIPMMVYIDLTMEQEQQLFHDLNNLGKKVSKDLTLSFNHSDPIVNLTRRVIELDNLSEFIQPLNSKKDKTKLFTFQNIYTTITSFFDKKEIQRDVSETMASDLEEFFKIVTDSFPEDVLEDGYLYKHAGILPGIALFANRMKKIQDVCWKRTLSDALSRVSFANTNHQFVRHGRALADQERKVTFSGSKGAISAVVKTLEKESLRLDKDGNELLNAYSNDVDSEPIVIVSEEVASAAEQEVAATLEEEAKAIKSPAEGLSASQQAILDAIDKSESKSLTGTFTQIAESLNFARSTTTDSLKKLETLGIISMSDENGIKTVTRLG